MSLGVGARLGHYAVTAKIGEGGMGEVWQATDTKLNRQVALKILPEAFAEDPDRLARFQREAQVLASLNHPGIAAIYGIEEAEDTRALVLELVEGPTLADRIAQGPIPVDEALPIAKQIAEALEAAHEQGVIHRDLKPANIKLKPDGMVKVLDFGLAKALDTIPEGDPSQSPTLTAAATQMGVIMGTAAYMSPEQARGKPVDKRSDIWAFGVVLFEMLTGQKAFPGDDVAQTLARVVEREPDWRALPDDVSAGRATYLRRCLEKEPKQRVADMQDVRLAIEGAFEFEATEATEPIPMAPLRIWQRPIPVTLTVLAVALASGAGVWFLSVPTSPTVVRFPIPLAADQTITTQHRSVLAISPDGSNVVYVADFRLWLRPVDQLQALPLLGTEDASEPFFSPDGQSIGFWTRAGQLKTVSVSGGPVVTLFESGTEPSGTSWGSDGMILVGQRDGVRQIPGTGGSSELLISLENGAAYRPQKLPGGEWVLFTLYARGRSWNEAQIVVQSLTTGEREVLVEGGKDGRYLPTGHLVYSVENVLFAVPFDADSRQLTGNPVPLVEGVRQAALTRGATQFAVSTNGSLVYLPASGDAGSKRLIWVERTGEEEILPVPPDSYEYVRLSPDGTRAAVEIVSDGQTDVWVADLNRGTLTRITTDPEEDTVPLWSLDGSQLLFVSNRNGSLELMRKSADGTGVVEVMTRLPDEAREARPESWTPDGASVAVNLALPETQGDIGMVSAAGGEWTPLINSEATEYPATISPNGRWLAYSSEETGQFEVYLDRFPELGERRRVSLAGGFMPTWRADSRELVYVNALIAESVMTVSVDETDGDPPSLIVGEPTSLMDFGFYLNGTTRRFYDLSPDGQRILTIAVDRNSAGTEQLVFVQDWFEELTEHVPIN